MDDNTRYTKYISEDFSSLHDRFVKNRSVSYDVFKRIWKELSFEHLFEGRNDEKDCREFAEECLKMAFGYCNCSDVPMVRIMGLYLSYAVYHTYPYELKVKIRLNLEEWKDIISFIKNIEKQISSGNTTIGQIQELQDAYNVFIQLRKDRAFCIAATKNEIHPVSRQAAEHELESERIEELLTRPRVISKIFDINTIDELSALATEYDLHKEKLKEKNPELDKCLHITSGDVVQKITKLIAAHEDQKRRIRLSKKGDSRSFENDSEDEVEPSKIHNEDVDSAERRKSIKVKAVRKINGIIRNKKKKNSASETDSDKDESPEKKSELPKKRRNNYPAIKKRWRLELEQNAESTAKKVCLENDLVNEQFNATLDDLECLFS